MHWSIPWRKLSFSSYSVVSSAFSALCAHYAHIRHSGIILTLGYPCAKFHFCRAPPIAELTHREKSDTHSLNHSLSHSTSLLICREPKLSLLNYTAQMLFRKLMLKMHAHIKNYPKRWSSSCDT